MRSFVVNSLGKLLGRKTAPAPACIIGDGSYLHPAARIINKTGSRGSITIGDQSHVHGFLLVWNDGGRITIGSHVYVGENTRIYSAARIIIGDRVQIAHNCNIFDNNVHSLDAVERHNEFLHYTQRGLEKIYDLKESPIVIMDDAWIGAGAIILKGVTVGRGAVVGAGSVVVKNVPDYAVVAGNPATIIRTLAT